MSFRKNISWSISKICISFWIIPTIAVIASFIALYMVDPMMPDVGAHAQKIANTPFSWHFLYFFYHLTIQILSGFSENASDVRLAIILMMSAWVGIKSWLSMYYSKYTFQKDNLETLFWVVGIAAVNFITALPILSPEWYLGKIFPNVWHNPSISFTIPFCIIAFYTAVDYLDNYSIKKLILFTVSCFIILLSKPSFFFCLAPAFLIFCLVRYKFSFPFWMALASVCVGMTILIIELFDMYPIDNQKVEPILQQTSSPQSKISNTNIAIGVLVVWKAWVKSYTNMAISCAVSFLVPIGYLILYPKQSIYNRNFMFACCLMVLSLLIFSIFYHTDQSLGHGNFYWQNIPASYLLHLVVITNFLTHFKLKSYRLDWKNIVFMLIYSMYVLSGLMYLFRLAWWDNYR